MAKSQGLPWSAQSLRDGTVLTVLAAVRAAIAEGRFVTTDFDHNSKNYRTGRSNKQVKIAAAILAKRPVESMDEAWQIVIGVVLNTPAYAAESVA